MSGDRPVVAVVGAGISGLAAAWELCSSPNPPAVSLLEAAQHAGGKIRGALFAGRQVDLGPDAFLTRRPEALELCRELGLHEELVAPATSTAYLWSGGRLRRLPAGLALGVPTKVWPLARSGLLSPWGLARAALDVVAPPVGAWRGPGSGGGGPAQAHDESIGEIVTSRLGRQVTERLADPLIGGIHAGGVAGMSAASVFPALLDAARRPGSLMRALAALTASSAGSSAPGSSSPVFAGLRGGLSCLVERLVSRLGECGAEVRSGFDVASLGRDRRWFLQSADGRRVEADAVLLALPAPAAAGLLAPVAADLTSLLGSLHYAGVVLVTMRFAGSDVGVLPPGSGFLVPRSGGGMVTACTWMSSKWPHLARPGEVLVRASLGRFGDERALSMDDDAVMRQAASELTPALRLRAGPVEATVARFPDAFPQYAVGHPGKVAAMEQAAARLGGLGLAGAYLQGVGIPACIASGRRAARAVSSHLEEAVWR